MRKCVVCGRKADYTILDNGLKEVSYCEEHFMEILRKIEGKNCLLGVCEKCG